MESFIENFWTSAAAQLPAIATPVLPALAIASERLDPIESFLISHCGEAELTAFAKDSTRSVIWVDGQVQFCELLLIPIVHSGLASLADNPQVWEAAQDPLVLQLIRMFPRDWAIGFFKGVVPVEDLLGMPWQALKVYLDHPSGKGDSHGIQDFARLHGRLPTTLPQLGFLVVKARCATGWPMEQRNNPATRVSVDPLVQQAALLRASQLLQLAAWHSPVHAPDSIQVLPPSGWSQGIGAGIRTWLNLLHVHCTITGYQIALDPRDVDLCSLEIRLADGGRGTSDGVDSQAVTLRIGFRRHAVTPEVWNGLLAALHTLADQPCSTAEPM